MADFWIVFIERLMSSILRCAESLVGIVPSAPTTTGTTLHLTRHNLSSSLHRSLYFSIFSSSLVLTLVSPGTAMSTIRHSLVSLFRTMISGLLASITRSVKTLKSQNNYFVILTDLFSPLLVPLLTMFKAMFFCQTPTDSSRHFIMPSFILWLRHFATLWNNVADCLICLFAHSTKR